MKTKLAFLLLVGIYNINIIAQSDNKKLNKLYAQGEYYQIIESLKKDKEADKYNWLIIDCCLKVIAAEKNSIKNKESDYKYLMKVLSKSNDEVINHENLSEQFLKTSEVLKAEGYGNYKEERLESAYTNLKMSYELKGFTGNNDTVLLKMLYIASYESHKNTEARNYMEIAIEQGVRNKALFYNLLSIYELLEKDEDILKYIKTALKYYPKESRFIIAELNYYLKNNDYEKAIARLEELKRIGDVDIEQLLLLASLYEAIGEGDKAVKICLYITKDNPNHIVALTMLGSLNLKLAIENDQNKMLSEKYILIAKENLEKAYEIDSESGEVLNQLVQLYSFSGDINKYEEVKKQLEMLP